jgi:glycosyltransferase involved in cell wall biosynthesis
MTKFSIVIPCFNAQTTIQETLASLQAQTKSSLEIICVDDGSTDATTSIIAMAGSSDPRIKLVKNPRKGPSSARNYGCSEIAAGEIIAFCDADDLWSPTKLEELSDAFMYEHIDAVYGQVAFFTKDPCKPKSLSTVLEKPLDIPTLLGENPVCTMSNIAVRRSRFTHENRFNEHMVHNEDLEWLVRIVGWKLHVVGLQSCQTFYRASPYGLSANLKEMVSGREAALKMAATFGFKPDAASNAIYNRYLARRALRLGQGRTLALRYVFNGMIQSPGGFFSSPKRGAMICIGAMLSVFLPTNVSRHLFSR